RSCGEVGGHSNVAYLEHSVTHALWCDACRYRYCDTRKRSACDLIAWIGSRSNLFSTAAWAAHRRRGAVPPLTYKQYDRSERYGGMIVARSTKHMAKKMIAALVDLAAGAGTARTIKGKAKGMAAAGAFGLARAAAAAAVRLEAAGKADAIAGRLEAQAASALKQIPAGLKSTGRTQADMAQHGAKK